MSGLGCSESVAREFLSVWEALRSQSDSLIQSDSRTSVSWPIRWGFGKHPRSGVGMSRVQCTAHRPPVAGRDPQCVRLMSGIQSHQSGQTCWPDNTHHVVMTVTGVFQAESNSMLRSWVTKSTMMEIWIICCAFKEVWDMVVCDVAGQLFFGDSPNHLNLSEVQRTWWELFYDAL